MPRSAKVFLLALILAFPGLAGYEGWRLAGVGSAFTAKYLCSEVFVGGRDAAEVARVDLAAFRSRTLSLVDWHVDRGAEP
jgi:hypothetical protein